MKMEQTECFETSAYKIQTPGNHPKESIQHSGHGESLKSRVSHILKDLKLHCERKGACCNPIPVFVTVVTLCTTYFNLKNIFNGFI